MSSEMGTAIRLSSFTAKVPVLIVGGGLAGFTAALSLHRAGIQNRLIMPESKFTQCPRSGVFLAGSAIRILDRLGLGSQYRALGIPVYNLEIEDTTGRNIMSIKLDQLGSEIWTVPRQSLQQLLLEAIPPDSVHPNTKLRSLFVEDAANVRVQVRQTFDVDHFFPDHPTSSIKTNFVIGADGLNSAVRTFMSRPIMTVPSGTTVWRAVVRNRDIERFPRHVGKEIWEPNRRFGFVRMNREEIVWWAVVSNFHDIILRPFSPHLIHLFQNFPLLVTELISSVESDRDIYRSEMKRVWPEQFPWVDHEKSRIALVGDAGRVDSTGNFQVGHTLAIEDSYLLASHLAEQNERGMLKEGPRLQRYQESREDRTNVTNQLMNRFLGLSNASSTVSRYISKKLLSFSIERMVVHGSPTIRLSSSDEHHS